LIFFLIFSQTIHIVLTVKGALKDILLTIATGDYVIEGLRKSYSWFFRHFISNPSP